MFLNEVILSSNEWELTGRLFIRVEISGCLCFSLSGFSNEQELTGRVIRVEFSKSFRKPAPPPPPGSPRAETRYKVYVGNLAWKVRSVNLKEFFSQKFNPVGARVVFDSPSGKSTGYGFVSFATMEEAQAAVKELDGKVIFFFFFFPLKPLFKLQILSVSCHKLHFMLIGILFLQ